MRLSVYSEEMGYNGYLERKLEAGQDALPYQGEHLISVADGSGTSGRMLFPHVANGIIDEERSFDIMTRGCGLAPDAYKKQYNDNFRLLYRLGKQDYERAGGRASAYFGSRLTTLFMRKIVEEELLGDGEETFFEQFDKAGEGELSAMLARTEDDIAKRLKALLVRAYDNAEMDRNTGAMDDMLMLCTTYSGICFYETEDRVHLLSLQAGDSMLWGIEAVDSEVGCKRALALRQLQPSQELPNGGVTNYISTNSDFYIRCAYHCLKKPCGILVATDGCFDAFTTGINFEFFLMNKLKDAKDIQQAQEAIQEYYDSTITGDDSGSLALRFFGMDDYARIGEMANRRQIALKRMYHADEKDLYDKDDSLEYRLNEARKARQRAIFTFKDKLWDESASLRARAVDMAGEERFARTFEGATKMARAAEEEARRAFDAERENLVAFVRDNWLDLRTPCVDDEEPHEVYDIIGERNDEASKARKLSEDMRKYAREIRSTLTVYDTDEYTLDSSYIKDARKMADVCKKFAEGMMKCADQMDQHISQQKKLDGQINSMYKSLVRQEDDKVQFCVDALIDNGEKAKEIRDLLGDDCEKIDLLRAACVERRNRCEEARAATGRVQTEFARRIYETRLALLLADWRTTCSDIPADLRSEIEDAMREPEAEEHAIEERKAEHDRYVAEYTRELQKMMVSGG